MTKEALWVDGWNGIGMGWLSWVIGLLRAPQVQLEEHATHYADTVPQKNIIPVKTKRF